MKQDYFSYISKIISKNILNESKLEKLDTKHFPKNTKQAYQIQSLISKFINETHIGWKIAATSKEGQKHISVNGPIAGRLHKSFVLSSGSKININSNIMKVLEAEFAFELNKNLDKKNKNYSVLEIRNAIKKVYPAIEIPDSRFVDFKNVGANALIADNACSNLLILGKPVTFDKEVDLRKHEVRILNKRKLVCTGYGYNVLNDPLIALTWLANELKKFEIYLKSNQIITTGTCIKPHPIESEDLITADFGIYGKVVVDITS